MSSYGRVTITNGEPDPDKETNTITFQEPLEMGTITHIGTGFMLVHIKPDGSGELIVGEP